MILFFSILLHLMHFYNINGFSFPEVYCCRYLWVDSTPEEKRNQNPFLEKQFFILSFLLWNWKPKSCVLWFWKHLNNSICSCMGQPTFCWSKTCSLYRVAHEKPARPLVDQGGHRSRTLYRKLNKCKCKVLTG